MKFIIVANDELAPLATWFLTALSGLREHSAVFWTYEIYRINQANLDKNEPFVFMGENEVSKTYINILPKRFDDFGTKCFHKGGKALLVAEEPDKVSEEDFDNLKQTCRGIHEELCRRAASVAEAATNKVTNVSESIETPHVLRDFPNIVYVAPPLVWLPWPFRILSTLVGSVISARKREHLHHELQYLYVLSRFLQDELGEFLSDIEGGDN